MKLSNTNLSYEAHESNWQNLITNERDERLYFMKNKDSLGYKMLEDVLGLLSPFLNQKSSWLTIGDYNGVEANYLLNKEQSVVASDISDSFLKEAAKEKLINNYKKINVENIDFEDNTFDYVLCKEAFHHFPRAYLGLYEMIRCSKNASIIIEPIDILAKMPTLIFIKNVLDRINPLLINKLWKNRFSFETVGNYVFKISEREVEKIAMGMGFSCIAFKGVNLILYPKATKDELKQVPVHKKALQRINRKKRILDILSFFKLIPKNHLCCVVFKTHPSNNVKDKMKKQGYKIIDLPKNPYL